MTKQRIEINGIEVGGGAPLFLIAGPCVLEDAETVFEIAASLKELTNEIGIPFIFKASYDKANRTSIDSFRGPGLVQGLRLLSAVKDKFGVSVLSDVHRIKEVGRRRRYWMSFKSPHFCADKRISCLQQLKPENRLILRKDSSSRHGI